MEDKQLDKTFKKTLISFLVDVMQDEDVADMVDECITYGDLRDILKEESEHIFLETLDGKCIECESKDEEIEDLKEEIESLEEDVKDVESEMKSEIEELEATLSKTLRAETLDDVFKIEAFKSIKDNFSVSEIESMMKKQ